MSDAVYQKISRGQAKANDALRKTFERDDCVCYLIKREGQTQRFKSVVHLSAGWLVKYSTNFARFGFDEFRGQIVLKLAATDIDLDDLIAQSSYIAYGVPDAANQVEVFEIAPDRKDVIPPNGSSPFWKVFATKLKEERFTIT